MLDATTVVCFVDLDSATRKLLLQFQTSFQCFNKNSICRCNLSIDFDNIRTFVDQDIFLIWLIHGNCPKFMDARGSIYRRY